MLKQITQPIPEHRQGECWAAQPHAARKLAVRQAREGKQTEAQVEQKLQEAQQAAAAQRDAAEKDAQ